MSDDPTIPGPPDRDDVVGIPTRDPRVGTLVAGKYRILQRVARGGMARIYKAEQLPLGRIVALKELITTRDKVDADPEFHQRFFLEASTLSKLTHPNTVRVFDYGQHDDAFYMVMEFVEGVTVAQLLRDEGPIEPLRALHITIEILRSLQEAHALGIVHRDLKPSNVMLVQTVEGEAVKVLDFGIAKVLQDNQQSITLDDRIVGSPRYMAPEQIRHGEIDVRTDIYALGVLLFELLTGKPPYAGDKTLETLMAHLSDPIPSLRARCTQDVPPQLEHIVTTCLAKKAADRPPSVAALKDALRQVLLELAETATTGSRVTTESLIRQALHRDRGSGSHARPRPDLAHASGTRATAIESPSAMSHPTLARPATERRSSGLRIAAALVILTGLGLGALAIVWIVVATRWSTEPVAEATPGLADTLVVLDPAAEPQVDVTVTFTSAPEGAEVWEGTRMHGVTPLELPLADGPERAFELKLEGHEPFAVTQGPSAEPVTVHAELTPLPIPEPAPAPKAPPRPKPKPKPDLDILIER